MRRGTYLVMRYSTLIGRDPRSTRRIVSVAHYADTAAEAFWWAQGFTGGSHAHQHRGRVWLAKTLAPAHCKKGNRTRGKSV